MKDLAYYAELFKNELFNGCIPFWLKHGRDGENGGLYTCLDREGGLYSTDKSVWMQGRCAYIFSKLCNTYGIRAEWLDLAESCLRFLDAYCVDKSDGRMYFLVAKDGAPLRKRRYFFSEAFYIAANAEYSKINGDKSALEKAREYYETVYAIYRDPQTDPYKITPKFIPGARELKALACPMILLNVNAVMRSADPERKKIYDARAKELIEDIKLFELGVGGLMRENAGPAGEYYKDIAACRVINPGHSLELCWFLADEAAYFKDSGLLTFAQRIFSAALDFGTDKTYGGLFYFKDAENMPVEAYEHDMKLWWPHNEAVIAALKLYRYTLNLEYYFDFERMTEYAFSHFSDARYGEWYGYLRRDGLPTEPPCKGHTYKGPFHVPRMLIVCGQILESPFGEIPFKEKRGE
jgi:N-acylglucosamine 2-epimerase